MQVRLLGPVEATTGTESIRLGSSKQRALLAFLALQNGGPATSHQLIDALWGEQPPGGGVKTLRFHISKLRAALAPAGAADVLVTHGGSYALGVRGDDVDAHHFARLVDGIRRSPAAQHAIPLLETALGLWRGPALADVADEPFALPEITRLEELRAAAEEDLLAALLEMDEPSRVVAEAERLVGVLPLRERRWELLITALYRAGRQADALGAFQRLRRTLVEELGLEPSPPLRDLERRVLDHDPSLDAPPLIDSLAARDGVARESRVAVPLPPLLATTPALPFVGRVEERERLAARWKDALTGERQVVLIAGEAGIGKTRLVTELARDVHGEGGVVILGRCDEELRDSYLPFAEALRHLVRHLPDDVLAAHVDAAGDDLAQLAPDLRRRMPGGAHSGDDPAEGDRRRLFDTVTDLLTRVATAAPLLVVLDDLHCADPSSLLLLRYLVRAVPDGRLAVVATYRDTDVASTHPLAAWLADLRREPGVERIEVSGLSEVEIGALLDQTDRCSPSEDELFAKALHAETEGNPFLVGEVLQQRRDGGGRRRASQGVREMIGRRLAALPAGTPDMVAVASVLGREVGLDELAVLAGADVDRLVDMLTYDRVRPLMVEVPGTVDRYRFTHALVQQALYDELPASRRARLHAKAGDVLAAQDAPAAVVARHFTEAAAIGRLDDAAEWHRRAAADATSAFAYEQAVTHRRAAVDLDERRRPPDAARRAELLWELGTCLNLAFEYATARPILAEAAELAEQAGRDDLFVAAALEFGGTGIIFETADCAGVPLLDRAAAVIGPADSPDHVRLLLRRAEWQPLETPVEVRVSLHRTARRMAERLGDHPLAVRALAAEVGAEALMEDPTAMYEAAAALDEAVTGAGGVRARLLASRVRASAHLRLGRLRDALAEFEVTLALDPQGTSFRPTMILGAVLDVFRGELDRAEDAFVRLARHEGAGISADYFAGINLGVIMALRSRPADGRTYTSLASSTGGPRGDRRPWAVIAAGQRGDTAEVVAATERWLENDVPYVDDFRRAESVAGIAVFAARARVAELCHRLDELLLPYSGQWIAYHGLPWGATDHYRAQLARGMGDMDAAEALIRSALADYDREGERPWRAHAAIELSDLLSRRNEPGDAEEASVLAAEAADAAAAMDLAGVARRAARVRERLGID